VNWWGKIVIHETNKQTNKKQALNGRIFCVYHGPLEKRENGMVSGLIRQGFILLGRECWAASSYQN